MWYYCVTEHVANKKNVKKKIPELCRKRPHLVRSGQAVFTR